MPPLHFKLYCISHFKCILSQIGSSSQKMDCLNIISSPKHFFKQYSSNPIQSYIYFWALESQKMPCSIALHSKGYSIIYLLFSDCFLITSEEGELFFKSPSDEPSVCGIYMIAEPDKRIQVTFNYIDVPCENGGLVAVWYFSIKTLYFRYFLIKNVHGIL